MRVGAPHPDLIARVLDWGADGLMVPHVNSAAEAEQIVQAAHYAPRGPTRFLADRARLWLRAAPARRGQALPAPLIMAQIETIEAV